MKISVVIPTRNRPNDLVRCVQSLIEQAVKSDEVIVIDSSDTPLFEQRFFENLTDCLRASDIDLVYRHTRPGAAYQRNIGIRLARGEFIYFFDDDVVLKSDYIAKLQNIMDSCSVYAGGMGLVRGDYKRFSINRFMRIFFLMQRSHASGMFTFSGMPTHPYGSSKFCEVQVLSGCSCYRADIVKRYLFDENLGRYSYMEDCDLSRRVSRSFKLFYNPDAQLDHLHSPLGRDSAVNNRAVFIRNYSYLFFKNFYPENKLRIVGYLWTVLGLFIEALVLMRSTDYVQGYVRGLREYYTRRKL